MNDIPLGFIIFQRKSPILEQPFEAAWLSMHEGSQRAQRGYIRAPSPQPGYRGWLTDRPRLRWEEGKPHLCKGGKLSTGALASLSHGRRSSFQNLRRSQKSHFCGYISLNVSGKSESSPEPRHKPSLSCPPPLPSPLRSLDCSAD